jgi:hypothetical protein
VNSLLDRDLNMTLKLAWSESGAESAAVPETNKSILKLAWSEFATDFESWSEAEPWSEAKAQSQDKVEAEAKSQSQ